MAQVILFNIFAANQALKLLNIGSQSKTAQLHLISLSKYSYITVAIPTCTSQAVSINENLALCHAIEVRSQEDNTTSQSAISHKHCVPLPLALSLTALNIKMDGIQLTRFHLTKVHSRGHSPEFVASRHTHAYLRVLYGPFYWSWHRQIHVNFMSFDAN